ncbi:macrophage colony-stimulating factor 1 receptor 2-like isoform X1 [Salarias fasciatus]|uniref:macrophage colony-stimulating factor 1 receptor 2-like isoform X1 n=1 Tax=Salarias fasciatus TaxID=181472 RepID=UPI001176B5D5|nr:macrophage colony-stimulating factor 1 receptor 2-like isoform X1 [Salarias fasciatus]
MWSHSILLLITLSCYCSAVSELLGPPLVLLNAVPQPNQTDVVLKAGSAFNLSCHGNASLSSTSFVRLPSNRQLEVRQSNPRHTGTYTCGYSDPTLKHLNSWIHLYVTDVKNRSNVFVSSARLVLSVEQGEDVPVKCLLSDPTVTNLTLQSTKERGLPPGMNVTFDLRKGALIHAAMTVFNGYYVCSGLKDGKPVNSKPVELLVLPRRQLRPPSVTIVQEEFVRLIGETFQLTCVGRNPSHLYTLGWTHERVQRLENTNTRNYDNGHLYINSTIWISAVSQRHAGLYTCKATNDVGTAMETARLRVLDQPYLEIHMQHRQSSIAPANDSNMLTRLNASAASTSLFTNTSTDGAHSANFSSSREEAFEGQDVTLTFVIDSYPPVRNHSWKTPQHLDVTNMTAHWESYTAKGYRSEFSLLLRRVHQKDRGQYSFLFSNLFFNGSKNINLRIYRPPSASVSQDGGIISCNSSGYPPPTIFWFSCHSDRPTCEDISTNQLPAGPVTSQGEVEDEDEEEEEVRTRLPLTPDDDVTIECEASNLLGASRAVFRPPPPPPSIFTLPLIGALTSATVLLLLLLVVVYKCRQKPRYEIRWKIIECTDGNNYTFIDPSQLPYDHEWEFPRDKLRLGAVLGSGAFGKVVEATAYGLGADEVTRVAVKMLKPSAHSEEREALMSELKILSHLGYHDNIVNLLGACTQGGPMLMITEYCRHGDLLNFLRGHAQDFLASMLSVDLEDTAFYKNVNTRLRSDSGISCCSEYQDMKPGVQTDRLSVGDLLWFSYQVAQGLDFLSSRNCIHRDVAARNVLLTDGCVAKICDFGLARDIRNDDSYIVQGNARLPVKWMSPESIFQCVYTVQSDVWSYGVLLWEIFSLGRSPYPNVAVDTNFYKMIKDGRHMEQPDYAPAEMYHLMKLCWSLEPTDRPTFKTIGQLIHRLLPSSDDALPQHSDQPTYRNIDECKEEEDEDNEEVGGVTLKRGEEREERRDDQDKEPEPMMKNIYQRS